MTIQSSARRSALTALLVLPLLWSEEAAARGATPYLPLKMSPDIERQIERVLLLGRTPVMRRPIPAAVVLDALPRACARDEALCEEVRRYLARYMQRAGLAHVRLAGAAVTGDGQLALPNAHGQESDDIWNARVQGHYQVNDHLIISAGLDAYDDETVPTGSLLSFGWDFAQLDLGYRDHWLSPLSDSSSLIGVQAPTMLSATISNYAPMTALGLSYQVFGAEMSEQDNIAFGEGVTSGNPRIAGLQLGIEPAEGYALAVNRITQYGGGARGGSGLSDFFDALTSTTNRADVTGQSTEDVNRVASLTSSIIFDGLVPFAVNIEYAGEDNTFEGKYRLGATNLSVGLDFPRLGNFDAGFEVSEWQNDWYVHHVYGEGLTNEGHVIGHWFGDNRVFGDAIGGHSFMLRGGWRLSNGDYGQAKYRSMELDPRWAGDDAVRNYDTLHLVELSYSTAVLGHTVEGQLHVGQDIFGETFARIGAAVDFARSDVRRGAPASPVAPDENATELFVSVGGQYSEVRERLLLETQRAVTTGPEANFHVGVGARRRVSDRSDLGVRIEFEEVAGFDLTSIRAIDYRYRLGRQLGLGAFFGAARYDIELAAHGYYFGAGIQYRDLTPGWDIGLDYRRHEKLTRDKALSSDPESNPGLPRRIIDIDGFSLYVVKRW